MPHYHQSFSRHLKIDYILLIGIVVLSICGLLMVYSASNVVAKENYNDSFGILEIIKIFMIIIYTVFLISIIIVLCNVSYKEFFKEK